MVKNDTPSNESIKILKKSNQLVLILVSLIINIIVKIFFEFYFIT